MLLSIKAGNSLVTNVNVNEYDNPKIDEFGNNYGSEKISSDENLFKAHVSSVSPSSARIVSVAAKQLKLQSFRNRWISSKITYIFGVDSGKQSIGVNTKNFATGLYSKYYFHYIVILQFCDMLKERTYWENKPNLTVRG